MRLLPEIPVFDIGTGGAPALAEKFPQRLDDILRGASHHFTPLGLAVGDMLAHAWLRRNASPLLPEIEALAGLLRHSGAYAFNSSFEFACSTAAVASPGGNFRLVRVLDWRLEGLGRALVLTSQEGPAGPFHSLTWPGFAGVVTGLAKGRFAAAINQPPIISRRMGRYAGWLASRIALWRSGGLLPAHLLRSVFEQARDFETAKQMLCDTPIALPAFFTLVGPGPGEGYIIERSVDQVALRPGPAAVANHWCVLPLSGRPNGKDSQGRQKAMERLLKYPPTGFNWLAPPVLSRDTRMVALADPLSGTLLAQGWERSGPATQTLAIDL